MNFDTTFIKKCHKFVNVIAKKQMWQDVRINHCANITGILFQVARSGVFV